MPRFALLLHDHPTLHWDLLLEDGPKLLAWRLGTRPVLGTQTPAMPLPDHRALYLDYEGPVSGNRGYVSRQDGGHFEFLERTEEKIVCDIRGEWLKGVVTIQASSGTSIFLWHG